MMAWAASGVHRQTFLQAVPFRDTPVTIVTSGEKSLSAPIAAAPKAMILATMRASLAVPGRRSTRWRWYDAKG